MLFGQFCAVKSRIDLIRPIYIGQYQWSGGGSDLKGVSPIMTTVSPKKNYDPLRGNEVSEKLMKRPGFSSASFTAPC